MSSTVRPVATLSSVEAFDDVSGTRSHIVLQRDAKICRTTDGIHHQNIAPARPAQVCLLNHCDLSGARPGAAVMSGRRRAEKQSVCTGEPGTCRRPARPAPARPGTASERLVAVINYSVDSF